MSNVRYAPALPTVDVIIADDAFVLRTFVAISAPVSVATDQQLFAVNLNAVHAAVMLMVLVADVGKKYVIHAFPVIIGHNVVALIIDKVHRTRIFFLLTYKTCIRENKLEIIF